MATNVAIKALYDDAILKNRVQVAMAQAARDIINENVNTANHPARVLWATRVLMHSTYAGMFQWFVAFAYQEKTEATITDAEIYNAVSAQIDNVASAIQ